MKVRSSHPGCGATPCAATWASITRSTGFVRPSTAGGSATSRRASGGSRAVPLKAKPGSHGAWSSIQALRIAMAAGGSGSPSLGIRTSGSSLVIRATSSLAAASPGRMPAVPESPPATRSSRVLSEKPPCRASPVWHSPHCFRRIGTTSWAKSTARAGMPQAAMTAKSHASRRRAWLQQGLRFNSGICIERSVPPLLGSALQERDHVEKLVG